MSEQLATVEIKAFVPARDFARSMEFYQALGFRRASVFDGIAYFHCGESSFLLQDFYVREHADNFQMHLRGQDVEAGHGRGKEGGKRFGVRMGDPKAQRWAMRDFALFAPSGVLWRMGQNLRGPAVGLSNEP